MIKTIIKRDNREMEFDPNKIFNVINKTFYHNQIDDKEIVDKVTKDVITKLEKESKEVVTVEHVQDVVKQMIRKNDFKEVAHSFDVYRRRRDKERKMREKLYKKIKNITTLTDRENANVGNSPSAKLLQIAEEASRDYGELYLIDDETIEAMKDNKMYPHDFSWLSVGTLTCCFIPLRKLLGNGFNPGHGYIRTPKRIRTAGQLSCIILQGNQNEQHGGQAFGWYERDMSPYVKAEYNYQSKFIKTILDKIGVKNYKEYEIEKLAWEKTEEETLQAMEGVVFNLNTMHSRAGAQIPFSSINIGTGITKEERLITKCLLLAYEKGLGKGEQPLFPNIVFKVKSGINYEPGTPNHDLLRLSMRVSANRLFPTYNFQDCSLNKNFPEDVPSMGCRTAVRWDRHSEKQTCEGRGNNSFTTIDNPGIALECKYGESQTIESLEEKFVILKNKYGIKIPETYIDLELVKRYFVKLDDYIEIAFRQLLARFKYQGTFTVNDFPFLMSGVWMGSENLGKNDKLIDVIKHGTLTIGYIGIAETLKCLVGKHHGEDKDALDLGIQIVRFMHGKTVVASELYDLNFSVIATPAEGLTGKLVLRDKELYGEIEGVTDKEWYTNSSHVPVEYNISLFEKIRIEGLFVKYCNGGSITYVELNESPGENIDAIYSIIQFMYENDIAVGAINFPCDRCLDCGHFGIIEGDICPICGSRHISRIRRITGYLAEIENFNYAKLQEALHRVKHNNKKYRIFIKSSVSIKN